MIGVPLWLRKPPYSDVQVWLQCISNLHHTLKNTRPWRNRKSTGFCFTLCLGFFPPYLGLCIALWCKTRICRWRRNNETETDHKQCGTRVEKLYRSKTCVPRSLVFKGLKNHSNTNKTNEKFAAHGKVHWKTQKKNRTKTNEYCKTQGKLHWNIQSSRQNPMIKTLFNATFTESRLQFGLCKALLSRKILFTLSRCENAINLIMEARNQFRKINPLYRTPLKPIFNTIKNHPCLSQHLVPHRVTVSSLRPGDIVRGP